jgi:hypothetical protein
MAIGMTVIILAILIAAIWILIEAKRMKHKIFAIVLIGLILFTYISFSVVLKQNDVKLNSASGIATAGKLYFSWLGGVFTNIKTVTTYALKQDWKNENLTIEKEAPQPEENFTSNDQNTNVTLNESINNAIDKAGSIWDKL